MARRWLVYLIVWRAAVTGCSAQCHTDSTRPQQLRAMPQFFQAICYPKYPGKYPNNAGCKWNISADVNYVVLVHVKWMDLEESESCQFDNVTIYDYSSFYPAVVWCTKSDNNQDFYSSGPNVVVTFTSDDSMTSAGFELDFKAVPKSQTPTKTSSLVWGRTTPLSLADSNNSGSGPWDRQHINTAALIGGLTAGLLLLFLVSALCRFYYKRSALTRRQPPRYNYNAQAQPIAQVTPIAQAPPYPPFSTVYQNNNNI